MRLIFYFFVNNQALKPCVFHLAAAQQSSFSSPRKSLFSQQHDSPARGRR
jgi:hypothetical protein